MKTTLFIVFSIFIVFGCRTTEANLTSQKKEVNYIPYYLKVYEADSLYIVGDYQRSYEILDSLFNFYEPKNLETINEYQTYVESAYLSGNTNGLRKKTNKLISNFGYPIEWFTSDTTSNLYKIFKEVKITDIEYEKLRNLYLKKIDTVLRAKVNAININDQYFRKYYNGDDILQKRRFTDSINALQLKYWFDRGIYPNEGLIGNASVDDKRDLHLSYIFLHIEREIRESYYIPKMLEFVKLGYCTPDTYAAMIDQIKYFENHKNEDMVFGEFNATKINVADYYKFNLKRKEIGLPSLEYTNWKINLLLEQLNKQ